MNDKKKKDIRIGLVIGIIMFCMVAWMTFPSPQLVQDDEGTWKVIWKGNLASAAENDPGSGASGWLATFMLNYSETPQTCLADNASTGNYDGWSNVSGYVNTDDTDTDLASEAGNYIVVRARFNKTHCWDTDHFDAARCRIHLTVSGDETISDVSQLGNDDGTDNNGGGVASRNDTSEDYIWINFYWDDNSNGYRITDDGSLNWNCTISAKY